jgi:dienelactone hydrolase
VTAEPAHDSFDVPAGDPGAAAAGRRIRGDVLVAPDARQGVILCHGFKGFARWAFFPHLADRLAARGLAVVSFDFSGSGVGVDRETFTELDAFAQNSYTRELADLGVVERLARARGWVRDGYGLFGHSRGGGVAVLHAGHAGPLAPAVGALVTWAAIAAVGRWSAPERERWRAEGQLAVLNSRTGQLLRLDVAALDEAEQLRGSTLDITAAAARVRAPWLIVHGTADETVSVDDARVLHTAAAERAELLLLDGATHTFDARHPMGSPPPAADEAIRATTDFFVRLLLG